MSLRDDFGSSAGTRGGYSGGAGGLGNGGVGGGMGGGGNRGGGMGGGAARNGGIGNRTGLSTGNKMYGVAGRNGVTFSGRPGGFAQQPGAYGISPQPAVTSAPLNRPASPRVPGLLDNPPVVPVADVPPPATPNVFYGNIPPAHLLSVYRDAIYGMTSPPLGAPQNYPQIGYQYNTSQPPGQSPYASWAGTGLWGINSPANRGPSTGTTQKSYVDNDGYPSIGGYDERTGAY